MSGFINNVQDFDYSSLSLSKMQDFDYSSTFSSIVRSSSSDMNRLSGCATKGSRCAVFRLFCEKLASKHTSTWAPLRLIVSAEG